MNDCSEVRFAHLTGERAFFSQKNKKVYDTVFSDGESPVKECSNIELENCLFKWRYPIWYSNNIKVTDSTFFEGARAAIWYDKDIIIENTSIDAPKCIRRCSGVMLKNVTMPAAPETLWHCKDVVIDSLTVKGDYFAMNSENMKINDLSLYGKYTFDGVKNVEIKNSRLVSKDTFWNSENVTVYDSFISAEYIGWNSKNLTFVNCTIESLQGFCYIENLKLVNCKLPNTSLAFEYSSVDADIVGPIDSIFNPQSGIITADSVGETILDETKIDPGATKIIVRE